MWFYIVCEGSFKIIQCMDTKNSFKIMNFGIAERERENLSIALHHSNKFLVIAEIILSFFKNSFFAIVKSCLVWAGLGKFS